MAQGGRPVPARRKMNVDLSSKTRLVQSFAVVTSAATAEEQVELARQCIVAVQPRSARYELVHFHMILQWNQEKPNSLDMIAKAYDILLKYALNLLKPKRPSVWRSIRTTNTFFISRVDCMIGARDVLEEMGYTEALPTAMGFPETVVEPDRGKVQVVAAELLMAKLEASELQSWNHGSVSSLPPQASGSGTHTPHDQAQQEPTTTCSHWDPASPVLDECDEDLGSSFQSMLAHDIQQPPVLEGINSIATGAPVPVKHYSFSTHISFYKKKLVEVKKRRESIKLQTVIHRTPVHGEPLQRLAKTAPLRASKALPAEQGKPAPGTSCPHCQQIIQSHSTVCEYCSVPISRPTPFVAPSSTETDLRLNGACSVESQSTRSAQSTQSTGYFSGLVQEPEKEESHSTIKPSKLTASSNVGTTSDELSRKSFMRNSSKELARRKRRYETPAGQADRSSGHQIEAAEAKELSTLKPPQSQPSYLQMRFFECSLYSEVPFLYTGKRAEVDWKEAGVSLYFPAAHLEEETKFSLKVVTEKYVLPSQYQGKPLVSSMYQITASKPLPSPVKVRMEHCAAAGKESSLVFMTAHGEPPYQLEPLIGGNFPLNENYGEIELQEFSIFIILQNILDWEMRFAVHVFRCNDGTADFVVTKDTPEHRTAVQNEYHNVKKIVEFTTICSFHTKAISLSMPEISTSGWSIKPVVQPAKLSMGKLHAYKPGNAIPNIKMILKWEGEGQPREGVVNIGVEGGDCDSFNLLCRVLHSPLSSSPIPSSGSRPQLSDLTRELKALAWADVKDMAVQLGLDYAVVQDAEQQYNQSCDRISAAMNVWLGSDRRASWKRVVEALKVVRKDVLAERITQVWVLNT